MKVTPAPAGDQCPPPTPDPPTPPGAQGPPTSTTDTTSASGSGREGGGRWAAAMLLLTHVVELAAMVASTLLPAHLKTTPTLPPSPTTSPHAAPTPPDADQTWGVSGVVVRVVVGGAPLLLVTAISLVWAVRAQDFSGRSTARLLCWLLHLLQASVLWRFLKVHLAFDPSDVAELGTLRFVQVHVHTLPFLVIHVAAMLAGSGGPSVVSVLVAAAMVVSVVVTIIVASTASRSPRPSSLTPPTITQVAHITPHNAEDYSHDAAARVVVGVTTSCVVWTRAVALAALLCLHFTWAGVVVGVQWVAGLVWLSLQEELDTTTLGPIRRALRRTFLAYLLLWDWHVFRDDVTALTVCARPRLPAAYYTLTAVQNMAITATWYSAGRGAPPVVRIAVFSSVVAAQAVALLLLALSYLYCSSLLPSWPRHKAAAPSRKPSLVTSADKAPPQTTLSSRDHNSSYVDFKDVEEGEETTVEKEKPEQSEDNGQVVATPVRQLPPVAHSTPRSPLPLPPRLMAAHLPPNMFSFSHDILPPRHAKSERSSTDNGSFNSRNTNTLPNRVPPEYDLLHRAHGSFSDSFSSLSCGTINRPGTSGWIPGPQDTRTPPTAPRLTLATHSACRSGYCHCKLFDGIDGPCDVEEEDEEEGEVEAKKTPQDTARNQSGTTQEGEEDKATPTSNSPDPSAILHDSLEAAPPASESAPKVAVVRGVQRFRVVCAACLHAHDPLLTRCRAHTPPSETLFPRCHAHPPIPETLLPGDTREVSLMRCPIVATTLSRSCVRLGGGSSTDYPSDTEMTATADTLSSASAESHSTYTTWPVGRGPGMARLLQLHPGSHDYVTAWLRHQQARGPRLPPPPPSQVPHPSSHTSTPEPPSRRRRPHRHLPRPLRHKDPPPPHLLQDLETVV
ncbi:hypothetical protein Pmani_017240 [Petrolisthes manimaculis]|uniref:XK-related protein n=1 Tax=Petrolisthes manimaculis TaxID=1843537 RepID=A0AAE1PQ41_9EUCA|nr:hypothetical protein Pmani_017240 [Petrolisthes manimaculis]